MDPAGLLRQVIHAILSGFESQSGFDGLCTKILRTPVRPVTYSLFVSAREIEGNKNVMMS